MHIILTSKNLRANAQHFYFDFKESSSDGGKTNTPSTQVLPVEELEVAVDEQGEKKVVVKQSDADDAGFLKNWGEKN